VVNYILWPVTIVVNLLCFIVFCMAMKLMHSRGDLFKPGLHQRVLWILFTSHLVGIISTIDVLGFNAIMPRPVAIFLFSFPFLALVNLGFIGFQNSMFVLTRPFDQLLAQISPSLHFIPILFAAITFVLCILFDALAIMYNYEFFSYVGLWIVRVTIGIYTIASIAMFVKIFGVTSGSVPNDRANQLLNRFFSIAYKIVIVFILLGITQIVFPLPRFTSDIQWFHIAGAYCFLIAFCGFTWVVVVEFNLLAGRGNAIQKVAADTKGKKIVVSSVIHQDVGREAL
jgi:hypothetical protein